MVSVFTKIINREIPAHIVYEDENFLAFLDINPLAEGHTLVIPKVETDYIFDLDETTLSGLIVVSQKVAKAIDRFSSATRVGIAVLGLEVPHAHIHLVPINGIHDIDFSRPKLKLSTEQMQSVANKIRGYLEE